MHQQKINIWVRNINNLNTPTDGLLGLGSGFYNLPSSPVIGGIAATEIWKTIHTGVDSYANVVAPLQISGSSNNISGIFYHGYIALNFNSNNTVPIVWNTNTNLQASSTQRDLYTVILHEMMHALGLNTLINENGTSRFYNINYNYFSRFDLFLKSNNNVPLLTYLSNSSMYNNVFNTSNLTGGTSVLHPSCAMVANLNTGPTTDSTNCNNAIKFAGTINQIPVYTPICYERGSSLSHFEDQCYSSYGNNNYFLMCNSGSTGITRRYLKPEERNALCDLGYSTNSFFGVSGTNISGTNTSPITSFNYGGTSCGGISIAGVNDGITAPSNTYTYIGDLNSTISISANSILLNDINATGFEGLEDITGSSSILPILGTSTSIITFSSSEPGVHLLRYVPTNGNLKGNITYIYVYVNDVIISCQSVPNTCDLVINGDFEQNEPYSVSASNDNLNLNCGWITLCGTPDRFRTNAPDSILQIPCNFHGYQYDATSNAGNRSYVGVANISLTNGLFNVHEIIKTKLKTTLVAGVTYQLSFKVSMAESWSAYSIKMQACVSSVNYNLFSENSNFAIPSGIMLTSDTQSTNTTGWDTLSFTFTANGGEQYLYLGGLEFPNINFSPNTPTINPVNNCNVYIYNPTQSITYNYIDNVSITPVDGTINLPSSISCGAGIINNLENLINNAPPTGVFSGLGVTHSGASYSFNPILAGIGNIAITYTYNSGLCPISIIKNITVNAPSITPTFDIFPTICKNANFSLPTISNNGIAGTWTPSFNNQITTTYTFTPNSNTCGIVINKSVTISSSSGTQPTFTSVGTICYGNTFSLPNISNNGVSGTWSPTVNNTQTTTYTFTPNSTSPCASTTTMLVLVNPATITLTGTISICVDDISNYSANVSNGVWTVSDSSLANINPSSGKLYAIDAGVIDVIYTVTIGSCTTTSTLQITIIDHHTQPLFSFPTTICWGTGPPILPNFSDNGIEGNWIPATIDNYHTGTYTFKPINTCTNLFDQTITVISNGDLVATVEDIYLPFSTSSQTTSSLLDNDTLDGTSITSNYLGLAINLAPNGTNITVNPNGTLNIPANLLSGTYPIKYNLNNACLQSNSVFSTLTIYYPNISASRRIGFEVCYNPSNYTTTRSILNSVTIGGLKATSSLIDIINITSTAGLTLNSDGTINVPDGLLPGSYYIYYDLCPVGSSTGCVSVIFNLAVDGTVSANSEVMTFQVTGAKGNGSFNIFYNDRFSNTCRLNGNLDPAQIDINIILSGSITSVPPLDSHLIIDNIGNVNTTATINNLMPAGHYQITYTICDAQNTNICSTTNSFIDVLGFAKNSNNIISDNSISKKYFNLDNFQVSPNPSNGIFKIIFNEILSNEISIELFSTLGQKLNEFKVNHISDFNLDLSNFTSGIYLIKIKNEIQSVSKLIIKK